MEQEKIASPMVFVSHASEDKNRFVIDFATKLRENGIDAWVDKWEIHPGDSLVDKIFEVGIGQAKAILIILSQNSIEKPWVKQELNASFVERMKRGTKIIPIILDDCAVPVALQSTVYVTIANINSYDTELKRIINSVYKHSEKPALGSPPTYIQTSLAKVPGLTRIDSLLLKLAGDNAIENGYRLITTLDVFAKVSSTGISKHDFFESLTVLGDRGYFDLHRTSEGEPHELELRSMTRGGISSFSITIYGFEEYSKTYVADYSSLQRDVFLQIANHNMSDSVSIAKALKRPVMVIDHIFELMDKEGLIQIIREMGIETTHFMNPSPNIRRLLEDS